MSQAGAYSAKDRNGSNLLDVRDALNHIRSLTEAVHMAAHALGREEKNAIHALADVIEDRLKNTIEMVEEIDHALAESHQLTVSVSASEAAGGSRNSAEREQS